MTKYAAYLTVALWAVGTGAQFVTCCLLWRKGLLKSWSLGILGLLLNALKSTTLMWIWWRYGFRAYSEVWLDTRWLHFATIVLLLLQALWALSRVWPQGRPFAVMVGSLLVFFAAAASAFQSGWIEWPGRVGAAVAICRSFSLAALLFIFWCGWVYRALRVTTVNARLWIGAVQLVLCIDATCLSIQALTQYGALHRASQVANQTAYLLACLWWWRMGAAGETFVLPEASDLPGRAWRMLEHWIEGERKRVAA